MNDIKGIIFDVDGTLYNQRKVRLGMIVKLIKYYLVHLKEWKDLYAIGSFRKFREKEKAKKLAFDEQISFIGEKISMKRMEVSNVINRWMFKEPLELIARYANQCVLSYLRERQNNGVRIIIYSDYPVEEKMKILKIKPDYSFYPNADSITELKPSKKAMEYILKTVELKPEELVYIGDRYEKDGLSALSVGVQYIDVRDVRNYNHEKIY